MGYLSDGPFERIWIQGFLLNVGQHRAKGGGSLGIRKIVEGDNTFLEFSLGRGGGGKHAYVSAVAKLNVGKAHELAHAIMHLTGGDFPCAGGDLKTTKDKHSWNLNLNLEMQADLCKILNNPKSLRQEILDRVNKKMDELEKEFPKKKEVTNVP